MGTAVGTCVVGSYVDGESVGTYVGFNLRWQRSRSRPTSGADPRLPGGYSTGRGRGGAGGRIFRLERRVPVRRSQQTPRAVRRAEQSPPAGAEPNAAAEYSAVSRADPNVAGGRQIPPAKRGDESDAGNARRDARRSIRRLGRRRVHVVRRFGASERRQRGDRERGPPSSEDHGGGGGGGGGAAGGGGGAALVARDGRRGGRAVSELEGPQDGVATRLACPSECRELVTHPRAALCCSEELRAAHHQISRPGRIHNSGVGGIACGGRRGREAAPLHVDLLGPATGGHVCTCGVERVPAAARPADRPWGRRSRRRLGDDADIPRVSWRRRGDDVDIPRVSRRRRGEDVDIPRVSRRRGEDVDIPRVSSGDAKKNGSPVLHRRVDDVAPTRTEASARDTPSASWGRSRLRRASLQRQPRRRTRRLQAAVLHAQRLRAGCPTPGGASMRLLCFESKDAVGKHVAEHVARRINDFAPTADNPFGTSF